MTPAELNALADEVAALDGPSREMDARIEALFTNERGLRPLAFFQQELAIGKRRPLPFTASLDAAMTLAPDSAFWSITMRGENRGGFDACCQIEGPMVWHTGATPAIALTAAALRAHAAIMERES